MNLKHLLFIFLTLHFALSLPTTVQELKSEIIASNSISTAMVGDQISDAFLKAFGNRTLDIKIDSSPIAGDFLKITCRSTVWYDPTASGEFMFWFEGSTLSVTASFDVGVSRVGGFDTVWKLIQGGNVPKGIEWAQSQESVTVELFYDQTAKRINLLADMLLQKGQVFDQAVVALVKGFDGPVNGLFTFPLSSGKFASDPIQFQWDVPGNYTVVAGLVATNIIFSAEVYPDVDISLTCDLTFVKMDHPLIVSASADWSYGNPLVLKADLSNAWKDPFGMKWLTIQTGSSTITLGESQTSFKMHGTGFLHWEPSDTVTVDLDIGGSELSNFMISVQNLPVFSFSDMYKEMTGRSSSALQGIKSKDKGIASFAVSNYNGQYQAGLTIEGVATVEKGGDIYEAHKLVNPDQVTSVYDLKFFSPIFSQNPEYIDLDLKVTNPWVVRTGFSITYLEFVVDISSDTTVSLNGDFSWKPKHQASPITWEASGNYDSASDTIRLNGDLTSSWPDAFGRKYLTINSASISASFSPSDVDLTFSGDAFFNFTKEQDDVSFSLTTSNNFEDISFNCQFNKDWTVGYVVSEIADFSISKLDDFTFENKVTVGFTLTIGDASSIAVTSTGSLLKKDSEISKALSKIRSNIETITWQLAVTLPLSAVNAGDWSISLTFKDKIELRPNLWFEDTSIAISHEEFSLSAEFKALLKHNPEVLTFKISGDVGAGDYGFEGEMLGKWDDVFGVKGFALENVLLKIDFSAAACAAGTCISTLDLGFTTYLGDAQLEFAGGVSTPDLLDSFLIASYKKPLYVSDVCEQWNRMVPHMKINMESVPKDWAIRPVSKNNPEQIVFIQIAAEDGSFGPYKYQEGFHIIMMLHLIGLDIDIDVGCTLSEVTPQCTFEWDVSMDKNQFENAINHELALENERRKEQGLPAPLILWTLNEVQLSEWRSDRLAQSHNPKWHLDFTIHILGHHHKTLDFDTPLTILHGDFNQFFKTYIKHIFDSAREDLISFNAISA